MDAMLDEMDSTQLRRWIAFDLIEAETMQREQLQASADAKLEQMKGAR